MDKLKLLKVICGEYEDEEIWMTYLPNVDEVLETLSEREQCILKKRFSGMTLKAIGLEEGVTPERVRQLVYKALRRLRHPARRSIFRGEKSKGLNFFMPAGIQASSPSPELLARAEEFRTYSIEFFELSVRSYNCLKNSQITSIGQLIMKRESDLLKIKNFGRKSLNEIKEILQELGLTLR